MTMNAHITKWLAAYHDGELRGRRLAQVEAHLAECSVCQAELDQLQALSSLLGEAPEAPTLTSPDRFAAQVGLRLSRRPQQQAQPAPRPARVWVALPITLMIGMAFLQIVQWLTAGLSLAQMFGYGESAISRLTSTPVQPSTVLGQLSAEFIKIGVPFSPQIMIGLILPAILAVAYLLWLIIWGLNQGEFEASQS
jgi:anti-sigma factor RsiW